MTMPLRTCPRHPVIVAVGVIMAAIAVARATEAPPKQAPEKSAQGGTPAADAGRQARIRRLEAFYADLYAKPLDSPERLPRLIAVISLGRINCPETTERLLGVFKAPARNSGRDQDGDLIVRYLAWEALHARHNTLTADQRRRWAAGGLRAADAGGFPGGTVAPLLRALAEFPPVGFEAVPYRLATRALDGNDLNDPSGRVALDALRDLVAAWHDPAMVRAVVAHLSKHGGKRPALRERGAHVLGGLPDAPAAAAAGQKPDGLWAAWLRRHSGLKAAGAGADTLKRYEGKATALPPPGRIEDPSDPKWRAELEIGALTVSDFDLVWCIDSTGSMNDENQLVAAGTARVVRVCALISRRARCGTVYFRHETDAALMKPCCERAKANPSWYQVKGYPLTTDAVALAATMAKERIPRPDPRVEGNVHPGGAFCAALSAAVGEMNWSKDAGARRVIVMVGDSLLTAGSEQAAEKLTARAKAAGYHLHAVTKGGATRGWAAAVRAGGGQMLTFDRRGPAGPRGGGGGFGCRFRQPPPAAVAPSAGEFDEIARRIIRESVAPAYRDRIDPLLSALFPYAQAMETAAAGGKATASPGERP